MSSMPPGYPIEGSYNPAAAFDPPPPPSHIKDYGSILTPTIVSLLIVLLVMIVAKCFAHEVRRHREMIGSRMVAEAEAAQPKDLFGLDASAKKLLPVFKFKKEDGSMEHTDCAVCLNCYEENESIRLLPMCNHAFHLACIDKWLDSHSECPICRGTIPTFLPPEQVTVLERGGSFSDGFRPSSSEESFQERIERIYVQIGSYQHTEDHSEAEREVDVDLDRPGNTAIDIWSCEQDVCTGNLPEGLLVAENSARLADSRSSKTFDEQEGSASASINAGTQLLDADRSLFAPLGGTLSESSLDSNVQLASQRETVNNSRPGDTSLRLSEGRSLSAFSNAISSTPDMDRPETGGLHSVVDIKSSSGVEHPHGFKSAMSA